MHFMKVLVLDNIRSSYNVGSILRTADAVGVERVICVGTTPYPALPGDTRPGHVAASNSKEIAKTALGAEKSISISYEPNLKESLNALRTEGYTIAALENSDIILEIPMKGAKESLNVAVSAGIAMYQLTR